MIDIRVSPNLQVSQLTQQEKDENVAMWASYHRNSPHRCAKDYLNITLKLFQKILLYGMMHYDYFMYIASRGQGKTWLTALFCVIRCILFPGTNIVVVACVKSQANELVNKILDDFCKKHTWGSANLNAEIKDYTNNAQKCEIIFHNTSTIKVVVASDNARSKRANIVIIDEFRMVDLGIVNTVLKRFLTTPRTPNYLNNPKYAHLLERNKEIYMSSAWYKSHWSYNKMLSYVANMLDDTKKYFVCGLPYQLAVKENLIMIEQLRDEMSEADFDRNAFIMEMECLWFGGDDDAFFKFDEINQNRVIKYALYPPIATKNFKIKIPDLIENESRIMSVDVALMKSNKHNNDATSIMINSATPRGNKYIGHILYLENIEGATTDELAMRIKELFFHFKCTDLVIDTFGVGIGVFDSLALETIDNKTGRTYPALTCKNDNNMAERCKVSNALPCIWSIKASAAFNNEMCTMLRNGLQQQKIKLLVDHLDIENILIDKFGNFEKLTPEEQPFLKLPYAHTSLLVNELINLQYEVVGSRIKISEKSTMRKDRYSSLGYNYWVQCQLEREKLSDANQNNVLDSLASTVKKLSRKMY